MDLSSHKRALFVLAIIGGVLIWNYNRPLDLPAPQETQRQLPKITPSPAPPLVETPPPAPIEPSPLDTAEVAVPPAPPSPTSLATSNTPTPAAHILPGSVNETPAATVEITEELDAVDATISNYRAVLGENPIGSNAEITGALLGNNLKQIKLEVPTGSQVNGEGEMCDRWGTPYFFHQLSKTEMEVRSAGPDRRMWTGDDSLIGSPSPNEPVAPEN